MMKLNHSRVRRIALIALCLGVTACTPYMDDATNTAAESEAPQPVQFKFLASGLKQLVEAEAPQRIQITPTKPATITKEPTKLVAPAYGVLMFGSDAANQPDITPVHVIIDDRTDGPKLYVDGNRNGDLTDDPPAEWKQTARGAGSDRQIAMFTGGADVELADNGPRGHIHMYRFERDAQRAANTLDMLFYYRDYAWQGKLTLGERSYDALLVDDFTTGDFRGKPGARGSGVRLIIDSNSDGRFDARMEAFDAARAFNINGTTYEVKDMLPDGSRFQIVKSTRRVPELGKPIDHRIGSTITPFDSVDLKGNVVRFPDDYAGKVVLIDFWATWCGPCIAEMPHLVRAYEAHKDNGLEILGVSLDTGPATKIEAAIARHKMSWRQVNDVALGQLYQIRSIPKAFLVEGGTGRILAEGASLRGNALHTTIEKALTERGPK